MNTFLLNINFIDHNRFIVRDIEDLNHKKVIFPGEKEFYLTEDLNFPDSLFEFIAELTGIEVSKIRIHVNEP